MILKVLPAFGWLVLKDSFDAGEVFSNELFTENVYTVHNPSPYSDGRFGNTLCGYQWLYTEGRVRHTNVDTGEYADRTPGYCNLVTWEKVGTFRAEFLEPTTLFCINAPTNASKGSTVPHTEYFGLSAGERRTVPNGTKLFLASGSLLINGNQMHGPRQLHFGSGDREVEALNEAYGYIFP
jgi:hypothetical protein